MSFAQDIVMLDDVSAKPPDAMIIDVNKGQILASQQQLVTAPPDYSTAVTTEAQSIPTSTKPTPPSTAKSVRASSTTASTPAKGIPEKTFSDPLRDLILLSEAILVDDESEYINKVKNLAEDSSCLEHVVEANSKDSYIQMQQQMKDSQKIKAMAQPFDQGITLFQNPKEMVDPIKEAEFLKTLEALDDTDDSDAVEKPVLGKISLVRRAKSAATRSSSDKKPQDDHPVLQVAWEEIEVNKTNEFQLQ